MYCTQKQKAQALYSCVSFFLQYYQDQDGRTLDLREEFGYRNVLHLFQILRWELRKENKKLKKRKHAFDQESDKE